MMELATITRTASRIGLQLMKHSPKILTFIGVGGLAGAGVMASVATFKAHTIFQAHDLAVTALKDKLALMKEQPSLLDEEFTEKDYKRSLVHIYKQTGVKLAKLYWPSVTLGAVSIVAILAGHKIISGRLVGVAAAYKACEESFREYRRRVSDEFGTDAEMDIYMGRKKVVRTDEDGVNETEVEEYVSVYNEGDKTPYLFEFSPRTSGLYDKYSVHHNDTLLILQQNYANDMLKHRGHLMLHEVLDMLGVPRTPASMVTGWIYDYKNGGDGVVDFNAEEAWFDEDVQGYLLNFNVDGVVYDLI